VKKLIDVKVPRETLSCPEFGSVEVLQLKTTSKAYDSMINLSLKHDIIAPFQEAKRKTSGEAFNMSEFNGFNHSVQHTNAQEQRLARISTSIVWLFIICHIWRMIPTIYECLNSENGLEVPTWPAALDIIEHISHSLILANSAVNFLIYVFM